MQAYKSDLYTINQDCGQNANNTITTESSPLRGELTMSA